MKKDPFFDINRNTWAILCSFRNGRNGKNGEICENGRNGRNGRNGVYHSQHALFEVYERCHELTETYKNTDFYDYAVEMAITTYNECSRMLEREMVTGRKVTTI